MFSRAERSANSGRHVFILVPDRDAVSVERRASTLDGAGQIDVVTFRRLANYIFRALGGISERYIGAGEKNVIMHSVLADISPSLREYGKISPSDISMTETLVGARAEMMRNMITPSDLGEGAARLCGRTANKLLDLSEIFAEFDRRVAEKWRDPDGMISAACEKDGVCGFFKGSDVYLDAFTSFTAQQYRMIEQIMRGADNVCITVAYEPDNDVSEPAFMTVLNTDRLLHETAKLACARIGSETVMRVPTRFKNEATAFLSANMWTSSRRVRPHYDKITDDVSVISAANAYAEAEAVATDICRLIHGGMRYKEIAVITRSPDEYGGIIDAVFEKYEIPYFISKKTDITELSLIKFVFLVLGMCEHGLFKDDVISYIKTDLCGVEQNDAFAFENYVLKWNISGSRFTDGDFTYHPRGIGERFTEEDEKKLDAINAVRRAVTEPLTRFFGVMKNAATICRKATALFDFLSALGVPERLDAIAGDAHAQGDIAREMTLRKLWRAFCDALDGLVASVGERKCRDDEFSVYLRAMLSKTDIGAIPTSVDEVLIADAVLTSVTEARAVYVIGCCDGGFPKKVGEDGIFTEREKSELEGAGIEISSRIWKKISDEMYYFYAAASSASERVTFTYPRAGSDGKEVYRSIGVLRVLELFPKLEVFEFEMASDADMIWNKRAAFEYAVTARDELGAALREYYLNDPVYAEKLRFSSMPMSAEKCALDAAAAKDLFGDKLNMSPSRLESYVKCRFAYFCEYGLSLSDDRIQRFGAVDIGSFMHKIMEIAAKFAAANPDAADEDIDRMIREAANDELTRMLCGAIPARLEHVTDYLCKSARIFVDKIREDIASSKFKPRGFELTVGADGIEPLKLSNGKVSVRIRGTIDRLDAYEGEDGTLHVLVCDYKTGKKTFDMKNIALGLDMQMLLYLFSVWENGEKYFGKKITPAGVMYIGIKPPSLDLTIEKGADTDTEKSGLFLAEMNILRAMDPALDGGIIPVKESDVEKYAESGEVKNVISLEALENLKKDVENTVINIAEELCGGKAYAKPISEGNSSPCRYCRYKPVCRRVYIDEENEK